MSSADKNLSQYNKDTIGDANGLSISIVASEWNEEICASLVSGAQSTLLDLGMSENDITLIRVPGTFELPVGASLALKSEKCDAVICLGCVIKGETRHDEYINHAVANAIAHLSMLSSTPIIFGVITADDKAQAIDRAGGNHGNKGTEGAVTAVKMALLKKDLLKTKTNIGF